jgi:hypothetical protein
MTHCPKILPQAVFAQPVSAMVKCRPSSEQTDCHHFAVKQWARGRLWSCMIILGSPEVPDEKYMRNGSSQVVSRRSKPSGAARTPCVEVDPAVALGRGAADAALAGEGRAIAQARGLLAGELPAARAVHEHLGLERGALGLDVVADLGGVARRGADDGLALRAVDAVEHVMLLEHEGRRHRDGAELHERGDDNPELVVAPEDDEDLVPLADALGLEEVGALVAPALDVAEREEVLLALGVRPGERRASGLVHADVVDDVVGEVEVGGGVGLELDEMALGVVGLVDVALMDVPHGRYLVGSGDQAAARRNGAGRGAVLPRRWASR